MLNLEGLQEPLLVILESWKSEPEECSLLVLDEHQGSFYPIPPFLLYRLPHVQPIL
jgi:hypothetical protein